MQPEMEMIAKGMSRVPFDSDSLPLLDGLTILNQDGFQVTVNREVSASVIDIDVIPEGSRYRKNVGDSIGSSQNRLIPIIGGIEIQVEPGK